MDLFAQPKSNQTCSLLDLKRENVWFLFFSELDMSVCWLQCFGDIVMTEKQLKAI